MAFENLTDKLTKVFKNLRSKGRLTEEDVKVALKEVKLALLEADVNYKVVKNFVKTVEERAVGTEVLEGLNPGQAVIKIVNEELTNVLGSETVELKFEPGQATTVIMLCGLQGAGKTTTAAKLAGKFIQKGKKPLLVALDVYRPAAIKQLQINGEKQGVDVFAIEGNNNPVEIARASLEYAAKNNENVVIFDTAGRLHVDEELMQELVNIKKEVTVHKTILVVDAMIGQDSVNVASDFNERIGIDGLILSKMDGDTRGGAALSIKAVTGVPILFVGMGEKLSDLEQFYPDRMANRILGMGDVLTLIDKIQAEAIDIDKDKEKDMMGRLKKGKFDFNDYLESMNQMKKMGGLSSMLGLMPNLGISKDDLEGAIDEKQMKQMEAIVLSMTKKERSNPKLLNPQRKHRIAKGAGVDIAVVNRFIKQFEQTQKMMKQMPGLMGGKKKHGLGGFGGLRCLFK
jgi:signal recognition particle subunit SRP54